ncbi:MAG: NUDIX hydrolase [Leptolyngbyaceae cyanobacterium]
MAPLTARDRQRLIALIQAYTPFNPTEAAHQTAVLDLLATSDRPLDRDNYEPGHITGSAWVVDQAANQVGLIFHHRFAIWLQPGGHVDAGETDLLAVTLREVWEEMGITVDPKHATLFDMDVHPIPETTVHPRHVHFDIRFLCRVEAQPILPGSDAEQGRWFALDELDQIVRDEGMQRMLDKCLQSGVLQRSSQQ